MAEDSAKPTRASQIDENLRRVYEEALNEEIPDKFRLLLDRLRTARTASPTDAEGGSAPADSDPAEQPENGR